MKALKLILIFALIAVAGFVAWHFSGRPTSEPQAEVVTEEPGRQIDYSTLGAPTFAWSYAPYEEDGIPRNVVNLTATYPDGTTRIQEVDKVQGGCNEHPSPDKDVYKQSEMIICYYAGLGVYYKVVEADGAYNVMRKEFEEASPDYNPPVQNFQTIVKF